MPGNPKIEQLQRMLNAKLRPSPNLKPDGYAGPETSAALAQYQAMLQKTGTGANLISAPGGTAPAGLPHLAAADAWMSIAIAENARGVVELPGAESNPRIDEYLRTCANLGAGAQNDETPWCSAFVNWVMGQAGHMGSRHALASSWLNWGGACEAQYGAIVVVRKIGASADASTGSGTGNHVGFVFDKTATRIKILGGNQTGGTRVSIVSFALSGYQVRGYRWPNFRGDANTGGGMGRV